jgi:hypothetical protein
VLLCEHCCRRIAGWLVLPDERKQETNLGRSKDVLDGRSNLGANTVTLDQADSVATLAIGYQLPHPYVFSFNHIVVVVVVGIFE